jgi:hypothetical protein
MSTTKEIYTFSDTMDNLISKLSARQRGIASDGDKEFCYKDSSSALRVLATQKKWNSSTLAWDYHRR